MRPSQVTEPRCFIATLRALPRSISLTPTPSRSRCSAWWRRRCRTRPSQAAWSPEERHSATKSRAFRSQSPYPRWSPTAEESSSSMPCLLPAASCHDGSRSYRTHSWQNRRMAAARSSSGTWRNCRAQSSTIGSSASCSAARAR
jgi:hypothetical protein